MISGRAYLKRATVYALKVFQRELKAKKATGIGLAVSEEIVKCTAEGLIYRAWLEPEPL